MYLNAFRRKNIYYYHLLSSSLFSKNAVVPTTTFIIIMLPVDSFIHNIHIYLTHIKSNVLFFLRLYFTWIFYACKTLQATDIEEKSSLCTYIIYDSLVVANIMYNMRLKNYKIKIYINVVHVGAFAKSFRKPLIL